MSPAVVKGATVRTDLHGVAVRLVGQSQRYRTTDTPTKLDLILDAVTRLSTVPIG